MSAKTTKARLGLAGPLVVVAMTMMAVAAVSASATLPEFKATKFPVTLTSEGLLSLQPTLDSVVSGVSKNISCKMSEAKGEITNSKEVKKILVTDKECVEESAPTKMCTKSGSPLGTIVTNDLKGRIGYIVGTSKTKVGVELEPETSGSPLALFVCEGEALEVTVEGCTIGEANPLNKSQTTGTLTWEANATNTGQQYTEIEGGTHKPCELTVHAGFFKLGSGTSWLMDKELETFAEAVELKA